VDNAYGAQGKQQKPKWQKALCFLPDYALGFGFYRYRSDALGLWQ